MDGTVVLDSVLMAALVVGILAVVVLATRKADDGHRRSARSGS
jgi:hypothetical protein